jgi:hypothetical protein
MAAAFQTEAAFQEQLDWTPPFVREEVWPIEEIADDLVRPFRRRPRGRHACD